MEVHPVWLFTTKGCGACDDAVEWLEAKGIAHHELVLTDPTNARSLRTLAKLTKLEVAAPAMWTRGQVVMGFDATTYERTLDP